MLVVWTLVHTRPRFVWTKFHTTMVSGGRWLQLHRIERVDQAIQIVLRLRVALVLTFRKADRRADRLPAVGDKFAVALLDGLRQGVLVRAAEEFRQIDLEIADRAD